MTSNFLDIFIIAVLALSVVMFLTGNGDYLLNLFSGKNGNSSNDEYEKDKLHKSSLLLCTVLLANELLNLFLGPRVPVFPLISVGITIAALVVYVFYLRKYARKK